MKYNLNMEIKQCMALNNAYALLVLSPIDGKMPECMPGQFVQVEVPDSKTTFLRRPISINMANDRELWLLIRDAGAGTRHLINSKPGQSLSIILPLGKPFSMPESKDGRILLVGGGVGVAPLLFLGQKLRQEGYKPEFALGARSAADLLELDEFAKYGTVHVSTEDGSMGEKGLITQHSAFSQDISHIACCGPTPMMRAVAKIAHSRGINCEVSLENMMACGIGACLCCVEDTVKGNTCVCTEGPVFNINQLKWEL